MVTEPVGRLTWTHAGERRSVELSPRETVLEALVAAEGRLPLAAECGGNGACGACLVRVEAGDASAPTASERANLSGEELDGHVRLACQLRAEGPLEVQLLEAPAAEAWRPLAALDTPAPRGAGLGAAVDLGSTRVRVSLCDLTRGARLGAWVGPNPQAQLGRDVLTRIAAAQAPGRARLMSSLAESAISDGLARALRAAGEPAEALTKLVVVGNTAMLALLSGRGHQALLDPERWEEAIDCAPDATRVWPPVWGGVVPHLVRPLGGFVGSDLLAAVLAADLLAAARPTALIDFGTNTEVALWDGATLWVTAAAGGPAFEGWGLSAGMPAIPGAIHRVAGSDDGDGPLELSVLGDAAPRGLCATGLIDLLALLRRRGRLDAVGRFTGQPRPRALSLTPRAPALQLLASDVDALQRAKAAVAAALERLASYAGLRLEELGEVVVTGALGDHLDLAAARTIGLLPHGDSALRGARELALLGAERVLAAGEGAIDALRARARHVNLGRDPSYDERFVERLRLTPFP